MKYLRSALLAASLLAPAMVGVSIIAPASAYAQQSELEDAAAALSQRTGVALKRVREIAKADPSPALNKAIVLSRGIIGQANEMLSLLQSDASEDELLEKLDEIKGLVVQLDATKRVLVNRYPKDVELAKSLEEVRKRYFFLEHSLTDSL